MKADGSISPPPQNLSIHISQQTAHDSHSTFFFFFYHEIEKVMKARESSSCAASSEHVTQQSFKSLITFSPSTPQQDTCVIYVHNRTNKDVDYLGYKWASITFTHCFIATCCSLAEGWRQICLSQKREQLKEKTFNFPQSLSFTNHLILPLSKCYSKTTNQLSS